jgi:hypothetical protein
MWLSKSCTSAAEAAVAGEMAVYAGLKACSTQLPICWLVPWLALYWNQRLRPERQRKIQNPEELQVKSSKQSNYSFAYCSMKKV